MKELKLKLRSIQYLSVTPFLIISLVFVFGLFFNNSYQQSMENCSKGNCQAATVRLTAEPGSNNVAPTTTTTATTTTATSGCGSGKGYVQTSIDFGCKGNKCTTNLSGTGYCGSYHNGITDLLFAIIRFLSDGVGLIVILSMIIGGIQYITARGDPNATQGAVKRLTSALTALLVFVFAYAILNYVVPNGFFNQ